MSINLTEKLGKRVRERSDKTFILKIGDPENNNLPITRSDVEAAFVTITEEAQGTEIRARVSAEDMFDANGVFTLKLKPTDNRIVTTVLTTRYETHVITVEVEIKAAGGNRMWNQEFLYEVENLRKIV